MKLFQIIQNVRDKVSSCADGVGEVLEDAAKKLKSFMAHKVRCIVQQKDFKEAQDLLVASGPE